MKKRMKTEKVLAAREDITTIENLASGIHSILGNMEKKDEYEVMKSALADIMMITSNVRQAMEEEMSVKKGVEKGGIDSTAGGD